MLHGYAATDDDRFTLAMATAQFTTCHDLGSLSYALTCCQCLPVDPCSTNAGAKLNGQTLQAMDLLLGAHPSSQAINVKREPEDLRKEPKNPRNQKCSGAFPLPPFSLAPETDTAGETDRPSEDGNFIGAHRQQQQQPL
uniref:Uncharacterized protein n=1 Tax=Anopheles merus TaxID=30066 RepID=A0A182UN51_ANOME